MEDELNEIMLIRKKIGLRMRKIQENKVQIMEVGVEVWKIQQLYFILHLPQGEIL